MQALIEGTLSAVPHSNGQPRLVSYDSGEEFSFYHWIEVCKLVDESDTPRMDEGLPCTAELEEALEETMSEVEPATTYQNFSRNVV